MFFKRNSFPPLPRHEDRRKIVGLTDRYQELFLKAISREPLCDSESLLLLAGIKEVSKYVESTLKKKLGDSSCYEQLNPMEKKAAVLYTKYSEYSSGAEEALEDISLTSVYDALGYTSSKKTFVPTGPRSYFVKYVLSIAFYRLLGFLSKEATPVIDGQKYLSAIQDDEGREIPDLLSCLDDDWVKKAIPSDILKKIKESFVESGEIEDSLVPYVKLIYQKNKESEK